MIACAAFASARILIASSDAAAGLNALTVVLCAYVRVILGALDTVFLRKPNID
jgi:hypothetical protein